SEMTVEFPGKESFDKVFHGERIVDSPQLAQVLVLRKGDVAGIANQTDDPPVAGIKTAMRLDDTRLRRPVEISLHANLGIEDQLVQIVVAHRSIRMPEVRNEESHPRISRLRIGSEQNIARAHRELSPRTVQPDRMLHTRHQIPNHSHPSVVHCISHIATNCLEPAFRDSTASRM